MNHNINIVTTTNPLTTEASIALVQYLNTLYKNEMAKKIILVMDISPSGYLSREASLYIPPQKHCIRKTVDRGKGSRPEGCPGHFRQELRLEKQVNSAQCILDWKTHCSLRRFRTISLGLTRQQE